MNKEESHPLNPKPIIAICYDFDGTLIKNNMQENSLIPEIGMEKTEFWQAVKDDAKKHNMDEVLTYMYLMLKKANEKNVELTKTTLSLHGEKQTFFKGVENWFNDINAYSNEIDIKHYIISSGLDEMIKGSKIGKQFTHIFASGFIYDTNDNAIFPARSVNYTNKVQYLFRINKGIENSWNNSKINRCTPKKERSIPFSQMIYIGDGETDVPAMKMINYKGGYSIAVWPPKNKAKKKIVKELKENNRCKFIAKADYRKNKDIYHIVSSIIDRIINEKKYAMNLQAK